MQLILLRHGQSLWNLENRFTGWTDVDLSPSGITECTRAAQLLAEENVGFDVCFTSLLKRAIRTLWIVLEKMDVMWLPVHRSWRLNERHYGALQGRNKKQTTDEYGAEQVFQWRRSYDVPPPPLDKSDPRYPGHDRRYADLSEEECPVSESLKDTIARTMPYWHSAIAPALKSGARVLVVAHGNSLRGLVKHLDGISDADIAGVNIPTGIPLVYQLDDDLKPTSKSYLGDPAAVESAIRSVADQARTK